MEMTVEEMEEFNRLLEKFKRDDVLRPDSYELVRDARGTLILTVTYSH